MQLKDELVEMFSYFTLRALAHHKSVIEELEHKGRREQQKYKIRVINYSYCTCINQSMTRIFLNRPGYYVQVTFHPIPGLIKDRGENIMLQNQRIMLCFDAHNLCQLCSSEAARTFAGLNKQLDVC